MGVFFSALALTAAALGSGSLVSEPLTSQTLPIYLLVLPAAEGVNFDLYDVRTDLRTPIPPSEEDPHTIFGIKRHLGVAAGYDNGIAHASIGLYVTVAQWGRWNFGIPSPEIGIGRYRVFDRRTRGSVTKTQSTILISLASVHYRGGHIRSIGKDWFFTLEQIFDARANLTGSQFGFSFASP